MKLERGLLAILMISALQACSWWGADDTQKRNLTIINDGDSLIKRSGRTLFYRQSPFYGSLTETFDNGQIESLTEYHNGERDGISLSWYRNGERKTLRYFADGYRDGVHQGWWPNGKIRFKYDFVKGLHHGNFIEWYPNGQIAKSYHYEHGQENGEQKAWRENGKLFINLVIKDGKRYGMLRSKACFSVEDGEAKTSQDN